MILLVLARFKELLLTEFIHIGLFPNWVMDTFGLHFRLYCSTGYIKSLCEIKLSWLLSILLATTSFFPVIILLRDQSLITLITGFKHQMLKQEQNLCLSGATTQEIGPCMKSFIVRLWIQIKNDEGVIFGGRQRALVVARLLSIGAEDLFVVCRLRKNNWAKRTARCLMKCASDPAFYQWI